MAETRIADSEEQLAVFSLESGQPLQERVCQRLGISPGRIEERDFEDGEHKIRPLESVRGRDVYVVQSLYGDGDLTVNDRLVRTLFLLGALRDGGARRVTVVAPYLCYSRKDMRTKPRDPVSTRYVAELFEAVGIDRMVTVDVHNRAAYQNAFRVPTEHLTAAPMFVDRLAEVVGHRAAVVVSPDAGGVKRAERFRKLFEKRLGRDVASAFIEKFRSEGVVRGGSVVGDVDGRVAIIIDDLISSGSTLVQAAESCHRQGAKSAYAAATHGVFSANADQVVGNSDLERLFVLDTVPVESGGFDSADERLEVLDCATLIADSIHRLHVDGSIVEIEGR